MKQYLELLQNVLDNGIKSDDRTGTGTISIFGPQIEFDLKKGFPAITTKKLAWRAVVGELLWFLEGSVNERRLAELTYSKPWFELKDKRTIWTDNFEEQGKNLGFDESFHTRLLGRIYGFQWRYFGGSIKGDQIVNIIDSLRKDPNSRRHIVTAWNPLDVDKQSLPPCHILFQFYLRDNKLSCKLYQRSVDIGLGIPFNIASYALLTHIIAREIRAYPDKLIISMGDAHIYNDHIEQIKEQLNRNPYPLPDLIIDDRFRLFENEKIKLIQFDFNKEPNYFTLEGYKHHPQLKMKMSV